ncbi:MAG: hypothetical protein KJN67_02620, partial [Pontiella sp.]|nr:hypothetical protein [Pontiella sp.]
MKRQLFIGCMLLAGCTTFNDGLYRPVSGREKKAFARADQAISPADVRRDFDTFNTREVAWAGIIKDIRFKETERTIQVAFQVEHRHFDWLTHTGRAGYRLSAAGDGEFMVGWSVRKPTSVGRLMAQAKPGYMLVAYGKPYRIMDGVIQL